MEYESEEENGWNLDNIYPLQEAVDAINELNSLNYKLNNCIRQKSLVEMRDALKKAANDIIDAMEQINDNDKIV